MPPYQHIAEAPAIRIYRVWPSHPLAAWPDIAARGVEDPLYLTSSPSRRPGVEADRLWAAQRSLAVRKRNVGSIDAVCELIKAQAGIAVLSRWGIAREIADGSLTAVEATPDGLPIHWHALTATKPLGNSPARTVAKTLSDWF